MANNKKYGLIAKLYRTLKYYGLLLLRKKDSSQNIAHGLSIGILVGFLPIIPLQAFMAVIVCSITRTNKFAGIIGTNIFTNAFNAPITFYFLHFVGKLFIPVNITYDKFKEIFQNISVSKIAELGAELWHLILAMAIGGVIAGIIFYPLTYYFTVKLINRHREKRLLKKVKRA